MKPFIRMVMLLYLLVPLQVAGDINMAEQEEIYIRPNVIGMPIGRIILIRKNTKYCSVKFTEIRRGKKEGEWHSKYESYYLGDGNGDFSNRNVQLRKGELSFLQPFPIIGRFAIARGNRDINCVELLLSWTGSKKINWVYFAPLWKDQGDYGIELAPTKWTDISEVNVFDDRLKWYKYDSKRKDTKIPLEELW